MMVQHYYQKIINKCPLRFAWLKKLGVASIIFFTLKGLVWLAVFAAVAMGLKL